MAMHYEQIHPLSRNPKGWFALGLSHDLAPGDVRPVSAVGRNLVVFRTQGGQAGVLDAYCPHLGAHLGYGGTVEGEWLRCPFHRWGFTVTGRCADIPYSPLPRADATGLPVVERNGAILAWFDPEGGAPTWDIPDFPSQGWSPTRWLDLTYEAHIQDFVENGVDLAHFPVVHASQRASVDFVDAVGLPFHYRLRTAYPGDGLGLPGQHIDVETEWFFFGVSLLLGISTAEDFGTQVRQIYHFTPTPGDGILIRVGFSANLDTIPAEMVEEVQARNLEILVRNFEEDRAIWQHKRYPVRPALCAGDGPFGTLRRWSRQFYPETASAAGRGPAPAAPSRPEHDIAAAAEPADPPALAAGGLAPPAPNAPAPLCAPPATVDDTIFVLLPASFVPSAAKGRAFAVQYCISGEAGGDYFVEVDRGGCKPARGVHPAPTVTVSVTADDWLKINTGALGRAKAFMSGRLKVKGDMTLAYRLGDIFRA